ncbi:DUF2971 domain-containing protein [Vibrio sp. SCSIO 43140]|uniref:DUF2971 domain-containing protein n=1 Tax=Vibrio sp. SCSIO 43140 TaxID=2819100 RepID=UPI00207539EC|nr:DUF2971 domain-containing protein [Vibrio sp. SCSIO 43140]USD61440.1 DUF2971 domain-containing protein [Vibrio sp. SCSIO 43140]
MNTPMLRATRTNDLNDPFELKPNQELIESFVTNEAPSEIALSWLGGSQGFAEFKLSYNKGIVALSECHDNLLMWSHYADEHRGGVVEFTFDLDSKSHARTLVQRGLFRELADNNYQYGLVRYRKSRSIDLSLINGCGYKLWEQIVDQLGFIKSKDWMYEEEHRFLVDMNYCNKTYIPDNEYSRERMKLFDVSLESVSVGGANYIVVPPEHILRKNAKNKECEPHLDIFCLDGFPVRTEYLQFVDINPECVTGLYLGAKMKDEQVESILSDTARLAKFKNLKESIYKAEIHALHFDLEFNPLTSI